MGLLFLSINFVATAQENKKIHCDNDCATEKLPFLFCDMNTGNKVTKCTADPNHEPGLRALRKRMPPNCRNYNAASFTLLSPGYQLVQISGTDTTLIFAPEFVDGAVFSDAIEWWLESGCPSPQTDGVDNCCLNVKWAQNNIELHDYSTRPTAVLALNWNQIKPSAGSPDCTLDCNATEIVINQTPAFVQIDANGFPQRFFYNAGEEPDGNGSLSSGDQFEYYDFYTAFMHELGHWYGIGHMGSPDSYGQTCGNTRGTSMMSGGTGIGGLYPGEERTLDDDDLCAFRKLYCCEQTAVGVEEAAAISTEKFSVYPNPLQSSILAVELGEGLALYSKILRLVDETGQIVREVTLPLGTIIYTINTDGLAAGIYMVTITADGLKGTTSKKIAIGK